MFLFKLRQGRSSITGRKEGRQAWALEGNFQCPPKKKESGRETEKERETEREGLFMLKHSVPMCIMTIILLHNVLNTLRTYINPFSQ